MNLHELHKKISFNLNENMEISIKNDIIFYDECNSYGEPKRSGKITLLKQNNFSENDIKQIIQEIMDGSHDDIHK